MTSSRCCPSILTILCLAGAASLVAGCYNPEAPSSMRGGDESSGSESSGGDESSGGGESSGGDESGDDGPAPEPDPVPEPECVPEYEWCNGVDDDCDGMVDEICPADGDAVVLSNDYAGSGYALAALQTPGLVEMVQTEVYPVESVWWIVDEGDGYFRFHSAHLGTGEFSLDSDTERPNISATGNYSGQYWRLTEVPDGCVRLTNMFLGEERSLDTSADEFVPLMAGTEETAGQCWTVRILE